MSTQSTTAAATAAATQNLPTHTFTVNLAPVNLARALKKYGLGRFQVGDDYGFKVGPQSITLHKFMEERRVSSVSPARRC